MRAKPLDVVVRYATNTYTVSACGKRASCTTGPKFAAERLGEKIFGDRFIEAKPMPAGFGDDHTVTRWHLRERLGE